MVSKLRIIGACAGIVTILGFLGFHFDLFSSSSPNITIQPVFQENGSETIMFVNIWNNGNAPATNVRITLDSYYPILQKKIEYSTEDTSMQDRGPKSLVITSPRLSANDRIAISNIVNSTYNATQYDMYVTYDQGPPVQYSTVSQGKIHFAEIDIRMSGQPSSVNVTTNNPTVKITPLQP